MVPLNSPTGHVTLEVSFISFNDDQLPGTNVVDYEDNNSFVLTTGGFPHEILCSTKAASANVNKIQLILNDAKHIIVELCTSERNRDVYSVLLDRTLHRGECDERGNDNKNCQVVVCSVNPEKEGRNVKALRLRILSGYSEFVGVYSIAMDGEESQQRIAVLESKPEVNLESVFAQQQQ